MNPFAGWFGLRRRPGVPESARAAAERWRELAEFSRSRPVASGRWVVVDVETSGLDASRDVLIAIGALAVNDGAVDIGDSFEVVLRQDAPSTDANIEVHGIGGTEQMAGDDPALALSAFLDFIGKDPLVAYHAAFDAQVLRRALDEHLGLAFRRSWLDLADVAPLAWPERKPHGRSLDAWLEALAIPVAFRHRAIADCLATAQLFLGCLERAPRLGVACAGDLFDLAQARRWTG